MKKIGTFIVAIFLIVGLIGCGKNSDERDTSAGNNVSPKEDVESVDDSVEENLDAEDLDEEDLDEDSAEGVSAEGALDPVVIDYTLKDELLTYEEASTDDFELLETSSGVSISEYLGDKDVVVIPKSLGDGKALNISMYAFRGNETITGVVIPETVTSVDDGVFQDCTSLKTVVFAGSQIEEIGDSAFSGDVSLEAVYLPETVKVLGHSAFQNCSKLTTIDFPKVLYSPNSDDSGVLASGLFEGAGITEFVIPETVMQLKGDIFTGCENLKRVVIPASVNNFEDNPFEGLANVKVVVIEDSLAAIAGNNMGWDMTIVED